MNTKPMDVLAVLQMWIDGIRRDFEDERSRNGSYMPEGVDVAESLTSARAAVAELITAVDEFNRAMSGGVYDYSPRSFSDAHDRLIAALARVKGEA